jgi:hypothetical protein
MLLRWTETERNGICPTAFVVCYHTSSKFLEQFWGLNTWTDKFYLFTLCKFYSFCESIFLKRLKEIVLLALFWF